MTTPPLATPYIKAPLMRRFMAMIYDTLLLAAVSMGYAALFLGIGKVLLPQVENITDNIGFQLGWLIVLVSFFCFFWRRGGQTLGMRAWRLHIVDEHGRAPSLKACLLRCVYAPISFALLGLGYWWALFDNDKRCLHDTLTRTRILLLPKKPKTSTA